MQIEVLDDSAYFALFDKTIAANPYADGPDSDEAREQYWDFYNRGFERVYRIVSKYGENGRDDYDSEGFSTFVVNDGSLFVVVTVWNHQLCSPELIHELQEFVGQNSEGFTVALEIEDVDRILFLKDRIVANLSDPPEPDAVAIIERFNTSLTP